MSNFTANLNMQIWYNEIRYSHRLIAHEVPTSLLSSWRSERKYGWISPRDLAFHLPVAKDFVNNFFVSWVHKEFADLL